MTISSLAVFTRFFAYTQNNHVRQRTAVSGKRIAVSLFTVSLSYFPTVSLFPRMSLILIHFLIQFGDKYIDVGDWSGADGDAQGHAEVPETEFAFQFRHQLYCPGFVCSFHGQDEFVAAHAEGVIPAHQFAGNGCQGLEGPVAGFMALFVVDLLEAVHIAEEEGRLCAHGEAFHIFHEGQAVPKARELVFMAQGLEPFQHIPIADEACCKAGQGIQQGAGFFHDFFRWVHHFRVAEGKAADDQMAGNEAL